MVQCDNCEKKLGIFSSKHLYEDDDGNTIYYCRDCHEEFEEKEEKEKVKLEKEKKKKDIKIIHENVSKSLELIQEIFENDAEKEYAKKIITFFFKKTSEESALDCPYIEKDNIGYKAKVIRKLRELEILEKISSKQFIMKIQVLSDDDEDSNDETEDDEDSTDETEDDEEIDYDMCVSFSANPAGYSTAALKKIEEGLSLHKKLKKK